MNKVLLTLSMLLILLLSQVSSSLAQTTTHYADPYRQTMWNNITDSVHTLGQTPQQAKWTKQKLHTARTKARLHSIYLANKAKRQAWAQSQ